MGYAALALAMLGFVLGTKFRLIVLLPFVILLLLASILTAVIGGYSLAKAALLIFLAQGILQSGYFIGLVAHAVRQR